MKFTKLVLFSFAFNFVIIGFASAYYFVIPQAFFSQRKDMAMIYYKCTSCSVAIENAVSDFNGGNYQIISWGLPDGNPKKLITVNSILELDYNIKSFHGGCMSIPLINCYNNKMYQLLFKKYGNHFIGDAFRKAVKLNNGSIPPQ
ncbi:hypothetical protein EZ428_10320 [Pedobacter frigiditerrae]|uniref:Uncharacterized protein n=1 Tax=Pedobacter frigiditerrae TaxID=2530452 RepID=A0A4R0MYU5_9SPHI|nr:hypothetical protein [Pedobacter frigiditerrae]TCC92117.1 hypothetical protein EZ428_10320 [Pedobacter frigiditerrae]